MLLKKKQNSNPDSAPSKEPIPHHILTASPQKQTVPGVHQQGWWHSSLGAQIKPSKLFKCSGEACGRLTVSGLNWLRHFSNQHFTCPVKTEIHSIVPFYTLVLHVYTEQTQPLRKKPSGLPGGASDGSLPANGGNRIVPLIRKDSMCMRARAGAALLPRHNWVRPPELLLRNRKGGGPAKPCREEGHRRTPSQSHEDPAQPKRKAAALHLST